MKYTVAHIVPGRLALLLVLVSTVLVAPARGLEAATRAAQVVVDYDLYERDVIEVKFREGLRVRLRNGVPTDLSGQALDGPQALAALDSVSDGQWTRSHRLDEATLDRMRAEGMARAERALPDLNHWFRLELPPGMEAAEAIEQFRRLPEVEGAFAVPKPAPPPLPPDYTRADDDNFDDAANLNRNVYQRYLDAAPAGLDFRFAWEGSGGAGQGIGICDVEYGWNEDHADLPEVTLLGPDPDPSNPDSWWEHGTAVLGQLAALDNGWGVTGMAHEAAIYFAAADTEEGGYNLASAISTCADELQAGDVILVEQQIAGPNATGSGQQGLVAVEWNKAAYDAIVTAVANGIVVVEAAGNGGENLDDDDYSTGNGGHHPFEPENDSGALIVGSANSPYMASPRARLSSSN
ncbi:MAG: S8 family serine peptidase [Chloroflexota bacterium]